MSQSEKQPYVLNIGEDASLFASSKMIHSICILAQPPIGGNTTKSDDGLHAGLGNFSPFDITIWVAAERSCSDILDIVPLRASRKKGMRAKDGGGKTSKTFDKLISGVLRLTTETKAETGEEELGFLLGYISPPLH